MAKTLATTHDIDAASVDRIAAQLNALRLVNVQADTINELQDRHARSMAHQLAKLEELRKAARDIGAYDLVRLPAAEQGARVPS